MALFLAGGLRPGRVARARPIIPEGSFAAGFALVRGNGGRRRGGWAVPRGRGNRREGGPAVAGLPLLRLSVVGIKASLRVLDRLDVVLMWDRRPAIAGRFV